MEKKNDIKNDMRFTQFEYLSSDSEEEKNKKKKEIKYS